MPRKAPASEEQRKKATSFSIKQGTLAILDDVLADPRQRKYTSRSDIAAEALDLWITMNTVETSDGRHRFKCSDVVDAEEVSIASITGEIAPKTATAPAPEPSGQKPAEPKPVVREAQSFLNDVERFSDDLFGGESDIFMLDPSEDDINLY